jgi:hypothetical protein
MEDGTVLQMDSSGKAFVIDTLGKILQQSVLISQFGNCPSECLASGNKSKAFPAGRYHQQEQADMKGKRSILLAWEML